MSLAVCVFCSSSDRIHPAHLELAAELGTQLARRGHDLVSGGGRVSMMGAVGDVSVDSPIRFTTEDGGVRVRRGANTFEE